MSSSSKFIPFGVPSFSAAEVEAVTKVLRSNWVGQGAEVSAFEEEFATYVGASTVLAVNSCTSALLCSLRALGVGPGDEVIVPSLTWCSSANAALYLGATPVFCDVELDSMSASAETITRVVTPQTKAVVFVHFGGLAFDIKALRSALPHDVEIVEDAAHALGARYPDGNPVGSSGNFTCFSFYGNKNLAVGDGGAIAIHDRELAERLRALSHQGLASDAWSRFVSPTVKGEGSISELGYKMNWTDLQASVGRVQLSKQKDLQRRRLDLAGFYRQALETANLGLRYQLGIGTEAHAHHLFVLRIPKERMPLGRDGLLHRLRNKNIGASVHYTPLHKMPLYEHYLSNELPNTECLSDQIITLPFSAVISSAEAQFVVSEIINELKQHEL